MTQNLCCALDGLAWRGARAQIRKIEENIAMNHDKLARIEAARAVYVVIGDAWPVKTLLPLQSDSH